MVVVEIKIELKEGVIDPEGKNVDKVLRLLGFKGIENVKSVQIFEIEMSLPPADAKLAGEEMCRKVLANPVIHNFTVTVR
ncbi:MAG: phosphoribosylformylglycinamidine synthase subunit PurS [archaeon]|nr:phosphoribosylformylglycinamidine synthase subunit PurS [archaeon]